MNNRRQEKPIWEDERVLASAREMYPEKSRELLQEIIADFSNAFVSEMYDPFCVQIRGQKINLRQIKKPITIKNSPIFLEDIGMDVLPDMRLLELQGREASLILANNHLKNVVGAPEYIGGDFDIRGNKDMVSLDGFLLFVGGNVLLSGTGMKRDDIPAECVIVGEIFDGTERYLTQVKMKSLFVKEGPALASMDVETKRELNKQKVEMEKQLKQRIIQKKIKDFRYQTAGLFWQWRAELKRGASKARAEEISRNIKQRRNKIKGMGRNFSELNNQINAVRDQRAFIFSKKERQENWTQMCALLDKRRACRPYHYGDAVVRKVVGNDCKNGICWKNWIDGQNEKRKG